MLLFISFVVSCYSFSFGSLTWPEAIWEGELMLDFHLKSVHPLSISQTAVNSQQTVRLPPAWDECSHLAFILMECTGGSVSPRACLSLPSLSFYCSFFHPSIFCFNSSPPRYLIHPHTFFSPRSALNWAAWDRISRGWWVLWSWIGPFFVTLYKTTATENQFAAKRNVGAWLKIVHFKQQFVSTAMLRLNGALNVLELEYCHIFPSPHVEHHVGSATLPLTCKWIKYTTN